MKYTTEPINGMAKTHFSWGIRALQGLEVLQEIQDLNPPPQQKGG